MIDDIPFGPLTVRGGGWSGWILLQEGQEAPVVLDPSRDDRGVGASERIVGVCSSGKEHHERATGAGFSWASS
jgi:hypothetical protein